MLDLIEGVSQGGTALSLRLKRRECHICWHNLVMLKGNWFWVNNLHNTGPFSLWSLLTRAFFFFNISDTIVAVYERFIEKTLQTEFWTKNKTKINKCNLADAQTPKLTYVKQMINVQRGSIRTSSGLKTADMRKSNTTYLTFRRGNGIDRWILYGNAALANCIGHAFAFSVWHLNL